MSRINPFDLISSARPAGFNGPRGVQMTNDLDRVLKLPEEEVDEGDPAALYLHEVMNADLGKPHGDLTLNVRQCIAIASARLNKGGVFFLPVGSGKGWLNVVLPTALYYEGCRRPLVLVPSRMRESARRVYDKLRPHFLMHPRMNREAFVGHSELSIKRGATLLDERNPDLIIIDEAQAFKRKQSARTRRLLRFIKKARPMVVIMSGTLYGKSLTELHHLLQMAIPDSLPLPYSYTECQDWARALDVDTPPEVRLAPGALERFRQKYPEAGTVAEAFGRRLATTPGIVSSPTQEVSCALALEIKRAELPSDIKAMIAACDRNWEDPNGNPIAEAVAMWRLVRQLALGYWYRWKVPAPGPWLEARRTWAAYVRDFVRYNQRGIDTEAQVASLGGDEWEAWAAVKDTFTPETEVVWESRHALDYCAAWLKGGGILWTDSPRFGERLAAETSTPFFGQGDDAEEHGEAPAIICTMAQATGKNLQHYSRNLVVSPPSDGQIWEQLLGRTHRQGQKADEVTCEILCPVQRALDAVERARLRAARIQEVQQTPQKLVYCDWV